MSLAASHTRIMFKHIAPNVLHIIVITFTLRFPDLVMTETVLTYLGIGIQTEPSWGAMINDARQRLWVGNWWEIGGVFAAMFFFVLALNLFGDALRDALDPKLRSAEAKSA
jgi:peptide/nickel transport system permease protein